MKMIVTVLLISFCIALVIWAVNRKNILEKSHVLGVGQITNCKNGTRGDGGSIFLYYSYSIHEKNYSASTSIRSTELSFFQAQKEFLGKSFPIVYNPKNPSISYILLRPKDFTRFGYNFPDSLTWVKEYFSE